MSKYRVIVQRAGKAPLVSRHPNLPDAMRRVERVLQEYRLGENSYRFADRDFTVDVGHRVKNSVED